MPFNSASFVSRLPVETNPQLARAITDMFLSVYRQLIDKFPEASKTFDPGSISAGAVTTTTVTVPGASVGDVALASHSDNATTDADLVEISAKVTATNTVTVFFRNTSGSPIDLDSGVLRALVIKKEKS